MFDDTTAPTNEGRVYLVGAGPGDPELLTLRGRRLLELADAVFYDELANTALLEFAPPHCERIYVGKRARQHSLAQHQIIDLMIDRARKGWCVVRLKGGDPFMFGRGGEELERLIASGVIAEAVPGVSAGIAVAEVAGIPLTYRGVAASVVFTTGHRANDDSATLPVADTLVFFMALANIKDIARRLVAEGRKSESTPVAVIERGTLPKERVVVATLADVAERVAEAAITSPALVVVGEVVNLRERMKPSPLIYPAQEDTSEEPAGIILMAHGSPLTSWHDSVEQLTADIAIGGQFCRAAYLPPARPSLGDIVGEAVNAGVRSLVVVPYFLAVGLHVSRDLPVLIEEQRQRHSSLRIALAPCLGGHPAIKTAVLARAAEAVECPVNESSSVSAAI